jgi:hypothetical protein
MQMKSYRMRASLRAMLPIVAIMIALVVKEAAAQAPQGAVEVSDRTGSLITRASRDYFGLFSSIDDFTSALLFPGDTDYVFKISRARKPDTTVAVAPALLPQLRRYIGSFESLFAGAGDTISLDWRLLSTVAHPSSPFTPDPMLIHVATWNAHSVDGIVIYADSNALLLASPSVSYRTASHAEDVTVLLPSELVHVNDDGGAIGHLFNEVDVSPERSDAVYQAYLLPLLRRHMLYARGLAPELQSAVGVKEKIGAPMPPMQVTVDEFLKQHESRRWHLAVYFGDILGAASSAYTNERYHAANEERQVLGPQGGFPSLAAEYGLTRRIRVGAAFWAHGSVTFAVDSAEDYERYYGTSFEALARFLLIPHNAVVGTFDQRFEVSAGAGIAAQALTIDSRVLSPFSTDYSVPTTEHKLVPGISIFCGFGYYFTEFLSLQVDGRFTTFSSQDIARREFFSLSPPPVLLSAHGAHTVTLAESEALVGLEMHL